MSPLDNAAMHSMQFFPDPKQSWCQITPSECMEERKSQASIRPKLCTNLIHRSVPVIFSTTKTYPETC